MKVVGKYKGSKGSYKSQQNCENMIEAMGILSNVDNVQLVFNIENGVITYNDKSTNFVYYATKGWGKINEKNFSKNSLRHNVQSIIPYIDTPPRNIDTPPKKDKSLFNRLFGGRK